MTGFDYQIYDRCRTKCKTWNLTLGTKGDNFALSRNRDNTSFGHFPNIQRVYDFLCGYEWGKETID